MADPSAAGDIASPSDYISPSSNPTAAASSTITPTHFQHKTTTAAPVHAFIDTAQPSLNSVPIELDSTPLSTPVSRSGSWKIPGNLQQPPAIDGLVQDDSVMKKLEDLRKENPAVLPGPPEEPGPEEFEAATLGDQMVTPV
jgi:hypothetical protein